MLYPAHHLQTVREFGISSTSIDHLKTQLILKKVLQFNITNGTNNSLSATVQDGRDQTDVAPTVLRS